MLCCVGACIEEEVLLSRLNVDVDVDVEEQARNLQLMNEFRVPCFVCPRIPHVRPSASSRFTSHSRASSVPLRLRSGGGERE